MTRGVQTDMEERIVAALQESPGATLRQLSDALSEEDPQPVARALYYLSQQAKPARIERTGETRWYRYWIAGTVPANPEPVPRDIRIGNIKGSLGHTAQLVQTVRENPGMTAVEIGKLTEIADGAKILAVLVRRGQMQAVGPRTRKRYYAIGHVIPPEAIVPALPKPPAPAKPKPKREAAVDTSPAEAMKRAEHSYHSAQTIHLNNSGALIQGVKLAERLPRDMLSFSIDGEGRVSLQRTGETFTLEASEVLAFYRFVTGTQPVWEGKAS